MYYVSKAQPQPKSQTQPYCEILRISRFKHEAQALARLVEQVPITSANSAAAAS